MTLSGGFSSQKTPSAPGPTLSESSFLQRNLFSICQLCAEAADQFPREMSKILSEYWTELKFLSMYGSCKSANGKAKFVVTR